MRCIASGASNDGRRPPFRARWSPSRPGDVDEHPRTELAALEGGDVVAERDLISGTARKVPMSVRVEVLLGEALVVPDVDRISSSVARIQPPLKKKPASDSRRRVPMPGGMRGEPAICIFPPPARTRFLPLKG